MTPRGETRELVGALWVDSGVLLLGDPSYTLPDGAEERSQVARSWEAFCEKLEDMRDGVVAPFALGGLGLAVSPGRGDGVYPVTVTRDSDGNITSVSVVFK